jgi:hypothetical protein
VLLSHFPEVSRAAGLKVQGWWRGLIVSCVLLVAARVQAEAGGLQLVSDSDVPAAIERAVKRKLGQVSHLQDERRGAALIVRLRVSSGELLAEFRDGGSGAVVSTHSFAIHGRRLKQPVRALRELVASAREHLSNTGASRTPVESDEAAELEEEGPGAREPTGGTSPPAVAASIHAESSSAGEEIMEDPELSARLAASSGEADAGARQGLGLQASVGIGPGVHALKVPAPAAGGGYGALDTGLAPAAALSAAAQLGLGPWIMRAEAQYRTFFGVESAPLASASDPTGMSPVQSQAAGSALSSHSFVIGASPGYRFGGRNSVAVLMMLGWTYRSLRASAAELPGVSLTGLVARPALHVPFGDGVFSLRIAPELVLVRGSETNAQGFMPTQASGGVGWGVEAAVDVRLAKLLGAGLQYRRSRVSATRNSGGPAIDEEWYVAVQAVLSL